MSFNEQHAIETFKSMISISTEAFKALQWLNGGAVVALMTYLAHTSAPPELIARAKFPLIMFVIGLIASTLAFATAYLTQLALHNENLKNPTWPKHGFWLWISFVICVISLAAFGWGAYVSLEALSQR